MDIEFHYYMTYLIAARANFAPADAWVIAHSAQGVDDNHIPVAVTGQDHLVYSNSISQTMDIVRPHEDSLIYPIFHFIPGDPNAPSAARVDGKTDAFVTTPNSALANQMIDAALASGDLYRIGVSAHGYVDTWAHQNFIGKRGYFNEFTSGPFSRLAEVAMAVGHAHAGHNPDLPGLIWEDSRLKQSRVVNRERFLDAAGHLFEKFYRHTHATLDEAALLAERNALLADLDQDIGPQDDANLRVANRTAAYCHRALEPAYGASPIPDYSDGQWFSEAFNEDHDKVRDDAKGLNKHSSLADVTAFLKDVFFDVHRQTVSWKDASPDAYPKTHWFQFQQAIKAHLNECEAMLVQAGLLTA